MKRALTELILSKASLKLSSIFNKECFALRFVRSSVSGIFTNFIVNYSFK